MSRILTFFFVCLKSSNFVTTNTGRSVLHFLLVDAKYSA